MPRFTMLVPTTVRFIMPVRIFPALFGRRARGRIGGVLGRCPLNFATLVEAVNAFGDHPFITLEARFHDAGLLVTRAEYDRT